MEERMSPPIEESTNNINSTTRPSSKKRTSKSDISINSSSSNIGNSGISGVENNSNNNNSSNNNSNGHYEISTTNGNHNISNSSHLLSTELKEENGINNSNNKKKDRQARSRSRSRSLSPSSVNTTAISSSTNDQNELKQTRENSPKQQHSRRSSFKKSSERTSRSKSRSNSRGGGSGGSSNKNSRSTSRDKEKSYRKSSGDLSKYKLSNLSRSRSRSRERRRSSNSSMSSVYKEKRRSRSTSRSISRSRSRERRRYSGGSSSSSHHRSSYDSNSSNGRRTSNSSMSSSKKYKSRSSRSSRSRSRSRSRSKSRDRKHKSLSRSRSRSKSRSRSRSRSRKRDRKSSRSKSRSNSRSGRKRRDRSRSRSRSISPTGKKRLSGWDNLPSEKKDSNIAQVPIIYPQQTINYPQSQFIPSIMVPNVHPISGHPQYPHHITHQLLSHQFVHIPPPQQIQPQPQSTTLATTTSPTLQATTTTTAQQDQCRVYIGNLHFSLGEDSILQAFSPFGTIKSILLGKDANGKSKGYAFIEYETPESATKAIESMTNYIMAGRVIKVARPLAGGQQQTASIASSSLPQTTTPTTTATTIIQPNVLNPQQAVAASTNVKRSSFSSETSKSSGDPVSTAVNEANRIYIGSINWNVTEDQIRGIFSQFGKIISCFLMQNTETGKHKGYGFIDFETKKSADDALTMNGFELLGRAMKVGRPTKGASANTSINGSIDKGSLEGETMLTTTDQRIQLTQKLLGNENKCLVLRNAGSPDDIDSSFEEDIRSGCNKFGEIDKLVIKNDSSTVRVYIVFKEASSCVECQSKLNGKYFSYHCIKAEFYDINLFNKQVFM